MDIKMLKKLSKKDRRLARQMARIQLCDQVSLDKGEDAWYALVIGKYKFDDRFKTKARYKKPYTSRCDTQLRGQILEHTTDTSGRLTFEPTIRQSNTDNWKPVQVKKARCKHTTSLTRRMRKRELATYNRKYGEMYDRLPVVKDKAYTAYEKFQLVA